MASGDFRSAAQPRLTVALQAVAARAFTASPRLAAKVRNAGEVAEFTEWQRATFGRVRQYGTREALWGAMADRMDGAWTGLELGVAWGYATDWWLRRCPQVQSWHGFDRFTGLPREWREHDAGAFGAGGEPPAITDPRVTWHVGDVEDTLPGLTVPAGPKVILFDLDLYEPTVTAWRHLEPHLTGGDLLYFDEAAWADERRVLDELVLPRGVDVLGATPLGLALAVH